MAISLIHFYSLDMITLAARLKDLREKRKLTQTRLAELIGVSPRVYNRWENSLATPHLDTVVMIANILEVSLDELAGRTESTSEPIINNPKLKELYRKVDQLSDADQQALIVLLDSLLARSHMDKMVNASQKIRR